MLHLSSLFAVLAGWVIYALIAEFRIMSAKGKNAALKESVDETTVRAKDAALSDDQLNSKLLKDLGGSDS